MPNGFLRYLYQLWSLQLFRFDSELWVFGSCTVSVLTKMRVKSFIYTLSTSGLKSRWYVATDVRNGFYGKAYVENLKTGIARTIKCATTVNRSDSLLRRWYRNNSNNIDCVFLNWYRNSCVLLSLSRYNNVTFFRPVTALLFVSIVVIRSTNRALILLSR